MIRCFAYLLFCLVSSFGLAQSLTEFVNIDVPSESGPNARLSATFFSKQKERSLPTVVIATPYRREIAANLYKQIVEYDFHLIIYDVRGSGSSAAQWQSFDRQEQLDFAFIIDQWVPKQPWSNGEVFLMGASYMGIGQLLAAGRVLTERSGQGVHLKGMIPQMAYAHTFHDGAFQGGVLNTSFFPGWIASINALAILPPNRKLDKKFDGQALQALTREWQGRLAHVPIPLTWISNSNMDENTSWFEERSPMQFWPRKPTKKWLDSDANVKTIPSKLPTVFIAGWQDIFLRGTLWNYSYGLQEHPNHLKRLIIGDWYHADGIVSPNIESLENLSAHARWFSAASTGGIPTDFPVRLFVRKKDKWRAEKHWPPHPDRVSVREFRLSSQKASQNWRDWFSAVNREKNFSLLEKTSRIGETNNLALSYNPYKLSGLISNTTVLWSAGIPALPFKMLKKDHGDSSNSWDDERMEDQRHLTFTSASFETGKEILGSAELKFWASSTLCDKDRSREPSLVKKMVDKSGLSKSLISKLMNKREVHWMAKILDVSPSGRAAMITSGWISSGYGKNSKNKDGKLPESWNDQNPYARLKNQLNRELLENHPMEYSIAFRPTSYYLKKGHKIRITLKNSDFPHLLPNIHPSESTLHLQKPYESTLTLPLASDNGEGKSWEWIETNKPDLLNF